MTTTYTVTNTFVADTTAVASEVNQNFTDILTGMNSYDASNLSSGTVPLARIAGLTTSQFAANVIDTDDTLAADSDTRIASQSATKSYVDTEVAGVASALTDSQTTLFNSTVTSSATFQDLDISGTVGSTYALVFIQVTTTGGGGADVVVKPKGEGGAYASHPVNIAACGFDFGAAGQFGYGICMTDSAGVLQIGASSNGVTITIKLLGYIAQ
jgi:hypothetical protein